MTREEYIKEHYKRETNYENSNWQEEYKLQEKRHVENFIKSPPIETGLLKRLERCLLAQKWISAKSSAHQYKLMKDFIDIDGNAHNSQIPNTVFCNKYWFIIIMTKLGDFLIIIP